MIAICCTVARHAIAGRSDLGNVGRRDHARRADRESAHHPRRNEPARRDRRPAPSADSRNITADRISTLRRPRRSARAGTERAHRTAQQHRRDLEPLHPFTGPERLVQAILG